MPARHHLQSRPTLEENPVIYTVSIQEASLSLDIRETEKICKLLSQVKTTLLEMQGPIFDCSAGSSESQFPVPRKERRGTETDAD
ncbi:hypothetical protein SKAU_G00182680 [Synaphobranchus kaupii]|uniref:Uncharacterized protein n=1 Tax=Synaphobranchus kaupii TaxID=118154 RepID=A0A9Q1FC64_SYNKA|nr:hypothetical protein SKAU_G00182680 [Synaphobranchus kaupii]